MLIVILILALIRNDYIPYSERETEANLLASNHFVKIDTKTDLLSMIYLHTSHHMTEDNLGKHQHITYNLDALEKQVRTKSFVARV